MAARRRAKRLADVHGVPPPAGRVLRVGALDEPGHKPARWRTVSQLASLMRVPLTPALRAHPMVARLLVAVGATEGMQTVDDLLDGVRAHARALEVGRRSPRPAGRPGENPALACEALILALEPVLLGRRSALDWKRAAQRLDLEPAARWARRLAMRAWRLVAHVDREVAAATGTPLPALRPRGGIP